MKTIALFRGFCTPKEIKSQFTQKVIGRLPLLITDRQHMSRLKYQFNKQTSTHNAKKNSIVALAKLTSGAIMWITNPISSMSVQAQLGRVSGGIFEDILVKAKIRGKYSKLLKLLSLLPATAFISTGLVLLDRLSHSWTPSLSLQGDMLGYATALYFSAFAIQLAQFLMGDFDSKEYLKKAGELTCSFGPLLMYAFCVAGLPQLSLSTVWLQSIYLVGRGLNQAKNIFGDWIGERATDIVKPQQLRKKALENKYVKEINNMKVIREGQKFRFTCHAVLNIQNLKQKLKENNKGDTQQALLLSSDMSHQQETLRTMIKNVPYLVLNEIQTQLTKVQNQILFEYPKCSRIDIELDHTKQLNNFMEDDQESVRIYWEELSPQEMKKFIMDSDWLLNEIERRTVGVSINNKRELDRENWLELLEKE